MSPSATYCWNCAGVGAGSPPLKPPIASTGRPLDSASPADCIAPLCAAAHFVVVPLSNAVSSELDCSGPPRPPKPDRADAGPDDGVPPECAVAAVASVNDAVPSSAPHRPITATGRHVAPNSNASTATA